MRNKLILIAILVLLFLCNKILAQNEVETNEKKTTEEIVKYDSTTGKTTKTIITKSSTVVEDVTPRKFLFSIDVPAFIRMYNVTGLYSISGNTSVGLGLQLPTESEYSGIGFQLFSRIYPKTNNFNGFYFEPNITVNSFKRVYKYYDYSSSSNQSIAIERTEKMNPIAIGVYTGWQWFWGDFAISPALGGVYYTNLNPIVDNGGYEYTTGEYPYKGWSGGVNGMKPVFRLTIGYAW
ncbi:MAG: hypothetical protein IPP08_08835 [Chlorobiota bacterium]|nr:hypothetical protein [Chlorobiota bacterium]QQS65876.1 MAG: hypothetical protein IPP08_08835 [Chlorobiota bacterium]